MDSHRTKERKISILAMTLLSIVVAMIFHITNSGFIPQLLSDHKEKLQIEKIRILKSSAVDAAVFLDVWQDEGSNSFEIGLEDSYNTLDLGDRPSTQIATNLNKNKNKNLSGHRLALYVDIDAERLKEYKDPTIFFYRLHGKWVMYLNGEEIHRGNAMDLYQAIVLPDTLILQGKNRIAWHVENTTSEYYLAFSRMHGISLRSKAEALWAKRTLPNRKLALRVISSCFFLSLAFVGLIMAGMMPKYDDLWAIATFCCAMALGAWTKSWEYENLLEASTEIFDPIIIRPLVHCIILWSALALSSTFFRFRGIKQWGFLGFYVVWSGLAGLLTYPESQEDAFTFYAKFETLITIVFFLLQFIIFSIGAWDLRVQLNKYKTAGLFALSGPMKRRFAEAGFFCLAIILLCLIIGFHMPIMTSSSGGDLFQLTSVIPVLMIFIQYYWMTSAAMRFKSYQSSRMDYIDYLALDRRNHNLETTYHGVLVVLDVKGFKRLTKIMLKSSKHDEIISAMLLGLQNDLANMFTADQTIFRYKSNGDEWIHVLYAQDQVSSERIFLDCASRWACDGTALIQKWIKFMKEGLLAYLSGEDAAILDEFDLHVMICILDEMKVILHSKFSKPDFISERFTLLTSAFKKSNSTEIAMYKKEAILFNAQKGVQGSFRQFDENSDFGWFCLQDSGKSRPIQSQKGWPV